MDPKRCLNHDRLRVDGHLENIYCFHNLLGDRVYFWLILAILVTGGMGTEKSTEVLSTNGSSICFLPEMPQSKEDHTQTGLTACGGSDSRRNCVKFTSGLWTNLTENLLYQRYKHSSWKTQDGDVLLFGSDDYSDHDSFFTSEIVYQNGTSVRSFDLKYDTM